jgi:hypothetical protein
MSISHCAGEKCDKVASVGHIVELNCQLKMRSRVGIAENTTFQHCVGPHRPFGRIPVTKLELKKRASEESNTQHKSMHVIGDTVTQLIRALSPSYPYLSRVRDAQRKRILPKLAIIITRGGGWSIVNGHGPWLGVHSTDPFTFYRYCA